MGLIYSSADSAQLISALRSNIQSAKETTSQLTSGSQRIVSAVDGRTLAGAAYTAGKGLFSELIIPTISRVTNAFNQLEQDVQKYQSADGIIKGEGSYLDEDIIKRKIEVKRAQKSSALTSMSTLSSQIKLASTPEMSSYIRSTHRELSSLADSLEEEIRKLQKKLEALHTFSSSTSGLFSSSLDGLKIAMQGVTMLSKTIVMNTGDYILPKGITLDSFNRLQTEQEVIEWEKQYGDINEWNSLYKKYIKATASNLKSIWYGARVSRLSDGTLIIKTTTGVYKRIDELTGFSEFVKDHKNFTRIGSKYGELTDSGLKILKKTKLIDYGSLTKGVSGRFKDISKVTWNSIKSTSKSGASKALSFGLTSIKNDFFSLKSARGFGKAVPVINLISGAIDVKNGIKTSSDLAKQDGLKGGEILASQVGGALVDTGKVVATTVAASVATSVGTSAVVAIAGAAGLATAPVGLVVIGAVGASYAAVKAADWVDKKLNISKNSKKLVNSIVKGVGGWFK